MKFSISTLREYRRCPAFAYMRNVDRRGLADRSQPLRLGTLWHEMAERKLKGADLSPESLVTDAEDYAHMRRMEHSLQTWHVPSGWHIEMVERAMECPLGAHVLQGKLDALVKWSGGWWSLQWKTVDQRKPVETECERVRISWHECAYQWLAEQAGYTPFHGTWLGVYRKLSEKALNGDPKKGVEPKEPFLMRQLPRDRELVDRQMRAIERVANEMSADFACASAMQDVDSCFGVYGNSRCQYYSVCHEGASLYEHPFVQLEDRYAAGEPNDGD